MSTEKQTSADKAASGEDAIAMLTADHEKVKALFKKLEKLKESDGADEEKAALVKQVCNELKVHAEIEEEIFYPAVREEIDAADLMDEALVEHAGAKNLIAELEEMSPDDELYDAKVTVLGEQIQHHVKEEEGDMFPKAKKAKVDTTALGGQMAERKSELMEELDMEDDQETKPAVAKSKVTGARENAR
ncbi:MAG: hemerythrin domain-containing protein [Steroidobacteraceae bacterium]